MRLVIYNNSYVTKYRIVR